MEVETQLVQPLKVEGPLVQPLKVEGPLVQPLNYRLPRVRTVSPLLLGPAMYNVTGQLGGRVVLPCRFIILLYILYKLWPACDLYRSNL